MNTRIEWTGNIQVHHPVKDKAIGPSSEWEGAERWDKEWNAVHERIVKRGEAITFYREIEERRAA